MLVGFWVCGRKKTFERLRIERNGKNGEPHHFYVCCDCNGSDWERIGRALALIGWIQMPRSQLLESIYIRIGPI